MLKRTAIRIPKLILVVAKSQTPPRKLRPAQMAKIKKKT
jgi:hypothetical protein